MDLSLSGLECILAYSRITEDEKTEAAASERQKSMGTRETCIRTLYSNLRVKLGRINLFLIFYLLCKSLIFGNLRKQMKNKHGYSEDRKVYYLTSFN